MNVEPRLAESDSFPALDFKFRNPSQDKDFITRVVVDVMAAEVDLTPILEYSLECRDGDLVLAVSNYGWGEARNFNGTIDLKALGGALPNRKVDIEQTMICADFSGPSYRGFGGFASLVGSNVFVLVDHRQLDMAALPIEVRVDPTWQEDDGRLFSGVSMQPPPGGIENLPGRFRYTTVDGRRESEKVYLRRIQRGMYDWRKIYIRDGRFEYVYFDEGVRYCMIPPSCKYHFLLDPGQGARTYEKSVAHEVGSGEYERIWLVLASSKSAFYTLRCRFVCASGMTVESPEIQAHIWNPQNSVQHTRFSGEISDVSYPKDYGGKPLKLPDYNVSRLRRNRSRSYGY